jgi:hypothetical protein
VARDDTLKMIRACGQNPSQADFDLALLEKKLNTKTSFTFEETQLLATAVWKHDADAKATAAPAPATNVNINHIKRYLSLN